MDLFITTNQKNMMIVWVLVYANDSNNNYYLFQLMYTDLENGPDTIDVIWVKEFSDVFLFLQNVSHVGPIAAETQRVKVGDFDSKAQLAQRLAPIVGASPEFKFKSVLHKALIKFSGWHD